MGAVDYIIAKAFSKFVGFSDSMEGTQEYIFSRDEGEEAWKCQFIRAANLSSSPVREPVLWPWEVP